MAYTRSLREIPLDQEPHASVLAALLPPNSPMENVDWETATADQIAHLRICPACTAYVGGIGSVCLTLMCDSSSARKAV